MWQTYKQLKVVCYNREHQALWYRLPYEVLHLLLLLLR